MAKVLDTVDDIEGVLGGGKAAAKRLGVTASTLSGWKKRGIPPARYKQINALLVPLGKRPADALFFRAERAA